MQYRGVKDRTRRRVDLGIAEVRTLPAPLTDRSEHDMSMTLNKSRLAEMNERIESVVSSGTPENIEQEPGEVIEECARRYIASQVKLRDRADGRSRETVAKFDSTVSTAKARLRAKANLITTELAQSLHKEWSAALLAGEFALPNGERVSWSEATSAQHDLRASQLEGLAAGDLATASIHRQAINDLRTAGVATLGELS